MVQPTLSAPATITAAHDEQNPAAPPRWRAATANRRREDGCERPARPGAFMAVQAGIDPGRSELQRAVLHAPRRVQHLKLGHTALRVRRGKELEKMTYCSQCGQGLPKPRFRIVNGPAKVGQRWT